MSDLRPTTVIIGIGAIGDCVLWTKHLNTSGYGQRRVNGRLVLVHRQAWTVVHGDPGAWQVLHRCDVRACINVDHMFLGTNADNVADKMAKGRQANTAGERNGRAKLTTDQVRAIRASTETNTAIARRLGVSHQTVSQIRLRKRWAHLP